MVNNYSGDWVDFFSFFLLRQCQYENSDQFQYADGLEKVQAVKIEA